MSEKFAQPDQLKTPERPDSVQFGLDGVSLQAIKDRLSDRDATMENGNRVEISVDGKRSEGDAVHRSESGNHYMVLPDDGLAKLSVMDGEVKWVAPHTVPAENLKPASQRK